MKNPVGFPASISFTNFIEVMNGTQFLKGLINSFIITLLGTAGIILMGAMAAYGMQRFKFKINSLIYSLFLFSLFVPFQVFIFPLMMQIRDLGFNNIFGLMLIYWTLGCPLTAIILHRFIKDMPIEQEEAAILYGATPLQTFFKIVLPQLKTIIIALAIFWGLFLWNDYLLPYLILPSKTTIQLALYIFFKQFSNQYGLTAASLILVSLPLIFFWILLRKIDVKVIMKLFWKS